MKTNIVLPTTSRVDWHRHKKFRAKTCYVNFAYSVPFPSLLELVSVLLEDLQEVLHRAGEKITVCGYESLAQRREKETHAVAMGCY